MATWRRVPAQIAAFGMVASLTVLWAPLGNSAAYLALICAGIGAALGWRNPVAHALIQQRWMQLFFVGFALLALAFLFNRDPGDAIYIFDFLLVPLGFVFAMALATLRGRLGTIGLSWWCWFGALAAAATGCLQVFALNSGRAAGWGNSPIHFADFAVIFGFMALGATFLVEGRWKWLLLTGPVLGLLAAAMADSRGAFLVAVGLAAIYALMQIRFSRGHVLLKLAVATGPVVVPLVAVWLANLAGFTRPFQTTMVFADMVSGNRVADSSSAYRLEMYRGGLRAFLDAPIFGYGWHSQIAAAFPYMNDFARIGSEAEKWGYLHNDALGFAVSGGLFALIGYLLWIIAPVVGLGSVQRDAHGLARSYLAIVLAAGLFMSGVTDVLFMSELAKVLLVGLTSAILILCRAPHAGKPTIP